ncbi:MAG: PAS domain-containing protein [Lentisphaerae bacterium]|nr:PAS domain-containing protein [Lentisphaerota bacterium]
MKTAHATRSRRPARPGQLAELRASLAEAREALRAIHHGEVDAVVVKGKHGPQIYTLGGAEHAYRVLIESMNEGALTLTTDELILYANQCFATMVKTPLAEVIGSPFRKLLEPADRLALRALVKHPSRQGAKLHVRLIARDGSRVPVCLSLRPLKEPAAGMAMIGVVVTDLTVALQSEARLRGLAGRLVQVQETERGRVALVLHDHITQLLCAIVARCQTLGDKLAHQDARLQQEAMTLREMVGQTAEEVERISHNLRPSALGELGLAAVIRSDGATFAQRVGLNLKSTCSSSMTRLLPDTELTLYRIFQAALSNVRRHARARHVTVRLTTTPAMVRLTITDDGVGFDMAPRPGDRRKRSAGFGLLDMRERAAYLGGTLTIKSAPGQGTTIRADVPREKRLEIAS